MEYEQKYENQNGLNLEETFTERISPSRCLRAILRPLTFSLTVSGMLYNHGNNKNWSVSRIFSLVILVVQWANFLRILSSIFLGYIKEVAFILILVIWTLECCLIITVFHATGHHLGRCFKVWDEHFRSEVLQPCSAMNKKTKFAKILSIILTIIGWSFQILNSCFLLFSWLGPLKSGKEMSDLLSSPFPKNDAFGALAIFLNFITGLCWIFPMMYMLALSTVFCQQFDLLQSRLQASISKETSGLPPNFEHYRCQHVQMTKLIEILDKQFRYIIFICYIFNIPLACFICYRIAKNQMDAYSLFLHLLWLGITTVNVILPSLGAAVVHEKVSKGTCISCIAPSSDAHQLKP